MEETRKALNDDKVDEENNREKKTTQAEINFTKHITPLKIQFYITETGNYSRVADDAESGRKAPKDTEEVATYLKAT